MSNYYYEVYEVWFDNHKDPDTTRTYYGRYPDYETASRIATKLAKATSRSDKLDDLVMNTSIMDKETPFFAELYDEKEDHIKQYAVVIEEERFGRKR